MGSRLGTIEVGFVGNRELVDIWNADGPLDRQSGLVRFHDLDNLGMVFVFATYDDGRQCA